MNFELLFKVPVVTFLTLAVVLSYFLFTFSNVTSWPTYVFSAENFNCNASTDRKIDDGNQRIFFLETSGRNSLNYRQSCAVESAARQNPNRSVQLFMSTAEVNDSSASMKLLQEYDNVEVLLLDLDEYFTGTPLEDWYFAGVWRNSTYSVVHLSDYLRILSVYKGGGQYLDLDFIVTQSMEGLSNYAVYETEGVLIGNSVFHFDSGHPIVEEMIRRLASQYNPSAWSAHGPLMVTSVIHSNCTAANGTATGTLCNPPVRLFNPDLFFPFPYQQWQVFFQNNTSYELPEQLRKAFVIHMWNKMSWEAAVVVGSSQYYAVLASKFCPLTFASALNKFK